MSSSRKAFHMKSIFLFSLFSLNRSMIFLLGASLLMATEIFMTHYYTSRGWQRNIPSEKKKRVILPLLSR